MHGGSRVVCMATTKHSEENLPYSTLHEDDEQFVVKGVVSGVVSTVEPSQAEVRILLYIDFLEFKLWPDV